MKREEGCCADSCIRIAGKQVHELRLPQRCTITTQMRSGTYKWCDRLYQVIASLCGEDLVDGVKDILFVKDRRMTNFSTIVEK